MFKQLIMVWYDEIVLMAISYFHCSIERIKCQYLKHDYALEWRFPGVVCLALVYILRLWARCSSILLQKVLANLLCLNYNGCNEFL